MIDIDNADIGIVVLGAICIGCVLAAAFSTIEIVDVKEIVLVCVSGIAGQMGKDIMRNPK